MNIPVFLSYPKPCHSVQQQFLTKLIEYLNSRGFSPRTLGVTDYDMDTPLKAIRRMMIESNGLMTIAFRRTLIEKGAARFGTDIPGQKAQSVNGVWLSSPWSQIEAAMAYQLGLPLLILREAGVLEEGLLEKGVVGLYMPEFDLDESINDYFNSGQWTGVIGKWEGYVRAVVEKKGNPPQLYL